MGEKSKTINMKTQGKKEENKLTYEQLEQVAGNLNAQCQQLHSQLRQAHNTIAQVNEIGMLLDILGKSEHFTEKFVNRCSAKIEELITKVLDASDKQEEEIAKEK
jgi:TolA-binding protein